MLGEPPLFEAAAADALPVVALLLLFGADTTRRGRHSGSGAEAFAPQGSAAATLLAKWARGDQDRAAAASVAAAALGPGALEAAVQEAASAASLGGSPFRAAVAVAGLSALGLAGLHAAHTAALKAEADAAAKAKTEPTPESEEPPEEPIPRSLATPGSPPVNWQQEEPTSRAACGDLWPLLASPQASVARLAWAIIAACEPRAALSSCVAASRTFADLLLSDSDEYAWAEATVLIAKDVVMKDLRRRGPDGRRQSWRCTFQEISTQQLFCWGVDGTVTGLGARTPSKDYSRPRKLSIAAAASTPASRPRARSDPSAFVAPQRQQEAATRRPAEEPAAPTRPAAFRRERRPPPLLPAALVDDTSRPRPPQLRQQTWEARATQRRGVDGPAPARRQGRTDAETPEPSTWQTEQQRLHRHGPGEHRISMTHWAGVDSHAVQRRHQLQLRQLQEDEPLQQQALVLQATANVITTAGIRGIRPSFAWPPLGRASHSRRHPRLMVAQAQTPLPRDPQRAALRVSSMPELGTIPTVARPRQDSGAQRSTQPSAHEAGTMDSAQASAVRGSSSESASSREPEQGRGSTHCFSIASGRRHCAVATFGGAAFAWGRDVALPAPPPPEVRGGLDAWHAWRLAQQARATTCDRPRQLSLSGAALPTEELLYNGEEVLLPSPSATLLRMPDGRVVCTGGWAAQESLSPRRRFEFQVADGAAQSSSNEWRPPPLRKVARGFCFNVALAQDGRVFVWRHSGLFPTGATERVPREPYSALPDGDIAVDVAVGEGHVLVLTEQGRVWTFGWQQRSALGRGSKLSLASAGTPALVAGLEGIVQIGAGATYSLCLDRDGFLWIFGEGPCVAGAFGDPGAVYEPRRVPPEIFGGRRVLSAVCGDGHVLTLTAWDPQKVLLQPGAWFCERQTCCGGQTLSDGDTVVLAEWAA